VPAPSDLAVLDWPLPSAWLSGGPPDWSCVRVLSGSDVQALVGMTGRNWGDFFFRAVDADQVYDVYLVPWLPGVDYTDEVASSGEACPDAGTAGPLN
jgi:hypothetical protein